MNPQVFDIIKLDKIKRQRQYENLQYNEYQIQVKRQLNKQQKLKQIQQSYLLNHQVNKVSQYQKHNQIQKKYHVRQQLKKSYNQQIYKQEKIKTEQKQLDKIYTELYKKVLEIDEIRRVKDMAKIYNIKQHKKFRNKTQNDIVFKTEGDEVADYRDYPRKDNRDHQIKDKRDYQRSEKIINREKNNMKYASDRKAQPKLIDEDILSTVQLKKESIKIQPQIDKKNQENINSPVKFSNEINQQNLIQSNHNHKRQTPRFSAINCTPINNTKSPMLPSIIHNKYSQSKLDYSDYLKSQVQRKQKQKQYKKRKQLQNDKNRLENQLKNDYKLMEEKLFEKQKQKIQLSTILDRQIKMKQEMDKSIYGNSGRRYFKY